MYDKNGSSYGDPFFISCLKKTSAKKQTPMYKHGGDVSKKMKLLQLYSCACSFQLSLDVLSLSLRSSLLNSLRSFLNQSLSLLQAQTCDLLR